MIVLDVLSRMPAKEISIKGLEQECSPYRRRESGY